MTQRVDRLTIKKYISPDLGCIGMTLLEQIRLRRVRPGRASLVIGAVGIIAVVSALAAAFDTFPGDTGALERFQDQRNSWLDDAARMASFVAGLLVVIISILVAAILLWLVRRKADSAVMLLVFVPEAINLALKELVGRPRPDFAVLVSPPTSHSFPSGHALHSMLFFGLLILVAGDAIKTPWIRIPVQGVLGMAILACGASRVYLGVHWPSDVLGGFLVGALFLVGLFLVRKMLINRGLQ